MKLFFKFKNRLRVMAFCVLTVIPLFCFPQTPVLADSKADTVLVSSDSYSAYLEKNREAAKPETKISLPLDSCVISSRSDAFFSENAEGKQNVLVWNSSEGKITFSFSVQTAGLYHLRMEYFALNDTADSIQLKMELDGKEPFSEAEYLIFPRYFKDSAEIASDESGNDIRPTQQTVRTWVVSDAWDRSGISDEPYYFYLSTGTHTLTLVGIQAELMIHSLVLYNEAPLPDYKAYAENAVETDTDFSTVIQAETAALKSDRKLYPLSDHTHIDTVPSDPVCQKLNTIGGANFSSMGQFLTWNLTVPKDGYYYISLRVRQNLSIGLTSYRKLLINGSVPFREANAIPFCFDQKWQNNVLGDENGDWLFFFHQGENTLTLQVVPGPTAELSVRLEELIKNLNLIYRQIIMVTGTSPDSYRDYQLEEEIPDLLPQLQNVLRKTETAFESASRYGNEITGDLNALQELKRLLESCIDSPALIPARASKIQSYSSTVSSLVSSMRDMPLELDQITVSAHSSEKTKQKSVFFSQIWFDIRAFLGSFTHDYNSVGVTGKSAKNVNVWVSLGRDQTQSVKLLAGSSFTPKTGIAVEVKLVQQSLVYASLSGRGPDVVLFVKEDDPVNLALRGAAVPLNDFSGFETVKQRFHSSATVPFELNGKTYALPLQQDFPMMFYRTDIFRELGLEVPETWDDFYSIIQILQRNNMTVGLPNMDSGSAMSTNNTIFAMFLNQMGGTYYNQDLSATVFDENTAIDAFTKWTDFYKNYGLDYQYDFYNRFVTGQMPIGLYSYTMYNKLTAAATEIRGDWEMTCVPGTVGADGTVSKGVCGTVTGAVILSRCKDTESAWEFLDWFTREDTQMSFGLELETLLGPAGRYNAANTQAFEMLPWTEAEKKLIRAQWKNLFQLEQVPGGYYVDRNLTNAFRKVVFYGKNPRETLINYNRQINREIQRKRTEFGLSK